jgi:hypothetical protein
LFWKFSKIQTRYIHMKLNYLCITEKKFPRISWTMTFYYLIEKSCYLLQYKSVCFLSENLIQSRDWLYKRAFNFWLSLRMLKFKLIISSLRISQCIGSWDEEPCSQRILKLVLFFFSNSKTWKYQHERNNNLTLFFSHFVMQIASQAL